MDYDFLIYNEKSDTFYINLDQVERWYLMIKHDRHDVVVIENERFDQITKDIDSGEETVLKKFPIRDYMSQKEINRNNSDNVSTYNYSKSKYTAAFAMLCFGIVFCYSMYLIYKYFNGAFMFTVISIISAFITLISAFMFLVYWAYESGE